MEARTKRKEPPTDEHSDLKRRKFTTTQVIQCVKCGTFGHNASVCPIKRQFKNDYRRNMHANKHASRLANIICYKCQGIGHYASKCHILETCSASAPMRIQDHAGASKPLERMSSSPRNWRDEAEHWKNTNDPFAGKSHFNRRSNSTESFRRKGDKDERNANLNKNNRGNQFRLREVWRRPLSLLELKRIALSDATSILTSINERKKEFMSLINSMIYDLDVFTVVVEILSKLSQSPFEELKSLLILDVCNSNFICSMRNYLINLPKPEIVKTRNLLYWKNQENFWKNFIEFCEDIIATSPATAIRTCRTLIESVTEVCLEDLNKNHKFILPEEYRAKLQELKQKLTSHVERNTPGVAIKVGGSTDEEITPPEDFHELSVIPTREDLLGAPPFLRPNITEGGYSHVAHYLDVQFRLLREDCFGPIRVGIEQYLADPTQRKYDHVRVYRNVKFVGPYISNLKVGYLVQVDSGKRNYFKRINWAHNKRFLFGSLVIFTKDSFRNCIMGTIIDRDLMLLAMGRIPITIIDKSLSGTINSEDTYTMIESDVYFEPYYQVLRALQAPSFVTHLPMQAYIVKVNPCTQIPAYLTENTEYSIPIVKSPESDIDTDAAMPAVDDENSDKINFNVSKLDTWPTKETLQFNESQYEAYKLALTHEFAVIQGPPGTGKTYVGLKVAETLLRNVDAGSKCLMLVVCYTNHALDQFLEGISKVTKDIVRIGSQSRNKAMDEYNLINIRKLRHARTPSLSYSLEMKGKLKDSIVNFQETLLLLDILNNGVVDYTVINDIQEVQLVCDYYRAFSKDPLSYWLFENRREYCRKFQEIVSEYEAIDTDAGDNEFNVKRKECDNFVVINEDKGAKELMQNFKNHHTSFLLIDAKRVLKAKITRYIKEKQLYSKNSMSGDIYDLDSQIQLFEDMSKYRSRPIHLNLNKSTDFSRISTQNRWSLYFMWIKARIRKLEQKSAYFQETVSSEIAAYEEARMMLDMELLNNKKVKVLGMTTSGAARMRKLIQSVSPKIVIVEEAAEVLEQHIITSLPKTSEHVILIGDHQQLRPSASYMKLAKKYNIEVSLFERMITNGMHSRRLDIQHRMRPEIAALISPHIYPQLENHPSVENFGDVLGLEKSVFFFSHEHEEDANTNDTASRSNQKEADIVLALANYLIQQGYKSDEVTILAAYSGQMFYMRKERKRYVHLSDIKITVLDNYQGEESRIIILSLVRNNPENNIGFLGIENRICVALSRAKQGFYMFGNINMLKMKSELWTKIATTLENNGSLGTSLNLQCQNHPDEITSVITVQDFDKAPEGGCTRKCNYQYSCGHRCVVFCHGYDRKHTGSMKCSNKCERIICELNHVCPLYCREKCQPCKVYVEKNLPCGHNQRVFCHREPNDPKIKCLTEVDITLPLCGHKARKTCFLDINAVICKEKCKMRLERCGHTCESRCHADKPCSDINYLCKKDCARPNRGCRADLTDDLGDHQCKKKCYENCDDCNVQVVKRRSNCKHLERTACSFKIEDIPCKKKCARIMTCGHNCNRKCFEKCGECEVMIEKEIPECKHMINIMCKIEATQKLCNQKCTRTMSCGHRCMGRCSAECDPSQCTQLSTEEVDSPCGHKTKLPCNIHAIFQKGELESRELLKYCNNPCEEELACQHICSGSCSKCYQGRLHLPCKQICNQLNICGHICQEPCNQMCPPCNKPCEVKCAHSRCSRLCGQPCVPCKEKCDRKCVHGACTKLCSQQCSREACSLPCPLTLACGHRCRGLCGEKCPDICHVCRPEQFPTGFIGEQYDEDAKFVLLQDCGHIVELESMDSIMTGHQETIKMRECPLCRKPVINTNRYKQMTNDLIKNQINPIKQKVYGEATTISVKYQELRTKVLAIYKKYYQDSKPEKACKLKTNFKEFMNFLNREKKLFILEVEMLIIYCRIIEMLIESSTTFANLNTSTLEKEFDQNIEIILKVLNIDFNKKSKVRVKISQQQQIDVGNEIKRLNAIVQLSKLLNIAASAMNDERVKNSVDVAKTTVFTLTVFDEDKALECLKILETMIKTSGIVSKLEREMIVKAVGLKAGHWFKCPNGHFYCIGECGGAMEIGKCPECGSSIGGTHHALLRDNAHAKEMDGSQFAAYSEQANNMANFLFHL